MLPQQFGHGDQIEQKNLQLFLMKYLLYFHLKINFLKNITLNLPCIGHPIFYIKNNSNLVKTKNNVAFLPGSRIGEIKSLFIYYQLAYEHIDE